MNSGRHVADYVKKILARNPKILVLVFDSGGRDGTTETTLFVFQHSSEIYKTDGGGVYPVECKCFNGQLCEAPMIVGVISDGKVQIGGDFGKQDAEALARKISGASTH